VRRLLVAAALAALAARAGAQVPTGGTVSVEPDTVTVGQPFRVSVHIHAPAGAVIVFPGQPDSASMVQALDPAVVTGGETAAGMDRTAVYRVAAWDVGTLPVVLPDAVVRVNGGEQRLPLGGATVFVKSVLPADSSLRVPRPARDLFVAWPIPWWILGVLAFIAVLLWWAWRRHRTEAALVSSAVPPFERAQREFARIAALGLVEAGERGRHVALMVEVLRDYLAVRFPLAALSLTSDELLAEVRDAPTLPHERLARLLRDADGVKFARRALTAAQAVALGEDARAIVAHEHAAATPPPAAEAA
jgi:hypothetical protein